MKEKVKSTLTVVLLLFAGVTLAVQIAKEFRTVQPIRLEEGLNVVCTHATARCTTCLTIEKLTRELLKEQFQKRVDSGDIVFRELNYEHPESSDFCNEYKVATASVVLVSIRNGETIAGVNLANESWKLHTDEDAFKEMLKEQIDSILQGRVLETDDSPQEIIFDDDESIELPL